MRLHHHGETTDTATTYIVQELHGESWVDFLVPFSSFTKAKEAAELYKSRNEKSTVRILQVCDVWM